jgi:copper chaperone CopZ
MRPRLSAGVSLAAAVLLFLVLTVGAAQSQHETNRYHIRGMVCQACADHVQEAIAEVEGVHSSRVVLEERMAYVSWEAAPRHDALADAVREAGFQAFRTR